MANAPLQKVCVFCSSAQDVDPKYHDLARQVGAVFADQNWHLIYGGSNKGLMGTVANSALKNGQPVTGVITDYLVDREIAHHGLTELVITRTMHERQQKMADLAEAFIIMPGGLGTLAEFFEILTWQQLGLHQKPIILLNAYGYWDALIEMIKHAHTQAFLYQDTQNLFTIIESPAEIKGALS